MRSLPMLKCCRLRWVCAPQYLFAGTSTSPRLSNSRRIPVVFKPMGMSRILGALAFVSVTMRTLLTPQLLVVGVVATTAQNATGGPHVRTVVDRMSASQRRTSQSPRRRLSSTRMPAPSDFSATFSTIVFSGDRKYRDHEARERRRPLPPDTPL